MQDLLIETDRKIAQAKCRIDEQRRRVLELERRGDDTTASANLLASMIRFLAIAEQRRETVVRLARLNGN
jgi:hypothetical protein